MNSSAMASPLLCRGGAGGDGNEDEKRHRPIRVHVRDADDLGRKRVRMEDENIVLGNGEGDGGLLLYWSVQF